MPLTKKQNIDAVELTGLTTTETRRFNELTGIIEDGMKSFLEIGNALAEVRDQKLYRGEFRSFDAFLEQRFGIKRHYACRLIQAEEVVSDFQKVLPIGNTFPLPANESQVRPLLRLETKEQQLQAWRDAVEASEGRLPTAAAVGESVKRLLADESASADSESEAGDEAGESDGGQEKEVAVLADGTERPDVLWPQGYVDSQLAQRKLDEIRDWAPATPEQQLVLQEVFLEITCLLNAAVDADPSKELREGVYYLFRSILPNLPLIAARPGDMEPRSPSEEFSVGRDD